MTGDKSTLFQVMAWCRQATSHYLSQCWPRYMLPYGITRPQCVNDSEKWRKTPNEGTVFVSCVIKNYHYSDVKMGPMMSQITSLTIVYSTVYSGANQRKHQSSVSLAFVRGIHWWPVNSPHKGPVTQKMFPFDDIIILGPLYWCRLGHKLVVTSIV